VSSTLALDLIWRRMRRPFNLVHAVPALTGIPADDVADLVTLHLSISDEAEHLLSAVPAMMRSLASSTTTELERSMGNVRGPIMWAETLTARANTFGGEDVFVCAAPRRDHDVAENRVLVTALSLVGRANRALATPAGRYFAPEARARIETNAATARSLMRARALHGVRVGRLGTRELHKVTSGRRGRQYATATDMLQRRVEPLRGAELHTLCDQRTIAEHHALVLVMAAIQRRGLLVPQFTSTPGELRAGKLRYRNWRNATDQGRHGILVGDVLVDTPENSSPEARSEALHRLERMAAGRRCCLVSSSEEAEIAVDLALEGTDLTRSLQPA
jgi:hypothetical protein